MVQFLHTILGKGTNMKISISFLFLLALFNPLFAVTGKDYKNIVKIKEFLKSDDIKNHKKGFDSVFKLVKTFDCSDTAQAYDDVTLIMAYKTLAKMKLTGLDLDIDIAGTNKEVGAIVLKDSKVAIPKGKKLPEHPAWVKAKQGKLKINCKKIPKN